MKTTIPVLLALVAVVGMMPAVTNAQDGQPGDHAWTVQPIELARSENPGPAGCSGVLREVRIGKNQDYDRVVFDFDDCSLPTSRTAFAEPPFYYDESEEIARVAGKSFLEVVFLPYAVSARDPESGQITVKDPEEPAGLVALKEVKRIYDHEGMVIYVLGLADRKPFRVQVLSDPSRLVVDVRH